VMNTFFMFISNEHVYKIYIRVWSEESTFIKKLMLDVFWLAEHRMVNFVLQSGTNEF
jgi:hypothetical protein